MKVVFIEEVLGTAVPGEVKEVRGGFARNYLLPRGLALPATKDALRRAEVMSTKEETRQAGLDAEARKLLDKLEGRQVVIHARVGEQGRLYGSVTAADIAVKLEEIIGSEFDRRRILLHQPIREAGTRTVTLRLTRNVNHPLEIVVEPEDSSRRRVSDTPLPPIVPDAEPDLLDEDEDDEFDDNTEDEDTEDV